MDFPELLSSEELDAKLAERSEPTQVLAYPRNNPGLPEPQQLVTSLATIGSRFNHIYERVLLLWGSDELDSYLSKLVTETERPNGDKRQGFPPAILEHILIVYNIHHRYLGKPIDISQWGLH